MDTETKEKLYESLAKELGKDTAEKTVAKVEATESAEEREVAIKLPGNFNEMITEAVAKASEAKAVAQKKVNFEGSATAKAQLSKADKRLEANQFLKFIADGDVKSASRLQSVVARSKALDEATAGVLVPELFETDIFSNFDTFTEIAGDARTRDYRGKGDVINLNQLDAKVVVYETGELGPVTASTPSYSAPNLEFIKYTAEVVVSEELLEDKEADLMGNISEQIGEQLAYQTQNNFVNDATSGKEGLFTFAGVSVVTMGNSGTYLQTTFADLKQLETSMAINYNKRESTTSGYYMSPGTWDSIHDNTVTSGSAYGQYAINPFDGTPMRAHGHDVRTLNEIASPTITGTKFVLFGDLGKHMIIGRKRGMRIKMNTTGTASDGTNLNTQDATQLVMTARIGHAIVLPSGLFFLVS